MEITKTESFPNPILDNSATRPFTITHADMKIPVGLVIKKGTVLSPLGNILYKAGKVYEAIIAGLVPKLYKHHSFGIGDNFFDGAQVRVITAIDTTNDNYDIITVDGVVTISLNEVVYSTASGAVASTGLAVTTEEVIYEKTSDTIHLTIADKAVLMLDKMPNFWAASIEASSIKTV